MTRGADRRDDRPTPRQIFDFLQGMLFGQLMADRMRDTMRILADPEHPEHAALKAKLEETKAAQQRALARQWISPERELHLMTCPWPHDDAAHDSKHYFPCSQAAEHRRTYAMFGLGDGPGEWQWDQRDGVAFSDYRKLVRHWRWLNKVNIDPCPWTKGSKRRVFYRPDHPGRPDCPGCTGCDYLLGLDRHVCHTFGVDHECCTTERPEWCDGDDSAMWRPAEAKR